MPRNLSLVHLAPAEFTACQDPGSREQLSGRMALGRHERQCVVGFVGCLFM